MRVQARLFNAFAPEKWCTITIRLYVPYYNDSSNKEKNSYLEFQQHTSGLKYQTVQEPVYSPEQHNMG